MKEYALAGAVFALAVAVALNAMVPAHAGTPAPLPTPVCESIVNDAVLLGAWKPARETQDFMEAQIAEGRVHFSMGPATTQLVVCAW